jgi:hypothetical protein
MPICLMYQPSQLDRILYFWFAFSSDRRTTDWRGQDNREAWHRYRFEQRNFNRYKKKKTRDGIPDWTDDRPTIRRKSHSVFHSLRRTKGMSLSSQGQEQARSSLEGFDKENVSGQEINRHRKRRPKGAEGTLLFMWKKGAAGYTLTLSRRELEAIRWKMRC